MKKLLILLLSVFSLTISAQQKKVAVYVVGQQSGITKILGDQLVVAFAKSGKYEAVERTNSFLAELSKEQNYQRSGAVNDNDIARLGIQFGVNYVCVAEMYDVFGEKYISARLIDVETAVVLNAHNVSGKMSSMDDCLTMASEIATKLSDKTIAEQLKIDSYLAQGYVDLGLPSGTLWKKSNEGGDHVLYIYDDAVRKFGNKLPTKEQFEELKNECKWSWIGSGYKVTGSNGVSITLPAAGWLSCSGNGVLGEEELGFYWLSTPSDSDGALYLYIKSSSEVDIYLRPSCFGHSVRLVQNL